MNDCHKVRCLYSVCSEGEASVFDAAFFGDHMAACGRCREDYAAFRAMSGALKTLPRLETTPGFEDRVLARVRAAAVLNRPVPAPVEFSFEPRWWEGFFPRMALGGVAAALALVGTLTLVRGPVQHLVNRDGATAEVAGKSDEITTLEQLYPDLSPEMVRSMQRLANEGVLDRMVIQHGSSDGDLRVVAPVGYGSEGPVTVSF
jgi:hypothetical protein